MNTNKHAVRTWVVAIALLLGGGVATADEIGRPGRVIVGAMFDAKAGKEAELEKFLADHTALTWKDKGCIAFRVFKTLPGDSRYFLFETWSDKAALDAHLKRLTPEFWARFEALTVGGLRLLKEVE